MPLLEARVAYKPFDYPWAYDAWLCQQQMHWLPQEVPLAEDVADWNYKLTEKERSLLTQIFRFFTQADIEVNNCYMRHYSRVFQPTEVQMMLASFSNMETVHIAAYSHLLDTVGMPETEYLAFSQYAEMRDKCEFMQKWGSSTPEQIARTLAVFGAFTEGLQLFASFAMLLNFPRFNKMKGMGQIITWSLRDETLHTNSIIRLFHTFVGENPSLDRKALELELTEACRQIVALEDAFIDLAFTMGGVEGMKADDIKYYIRYTADLRLDQLKISPIYNIAEHPLPWLSELLSGNEHTNFFENRATEYARAASIGDWQEVFSESFARA